MKDSVILGTGNSRYLKSVADFKSLYPTYEDFAAALVSGTLPVDFNGTNSTGFQQVGDALNKATLLKDATAALLGGDESMLPDEALAALIQVVTSNYSELSSLLADKAKIITGSYRGTGDYGSSTPSSLSFPFVPKFLLIFAGHNSEWAMCSPEKLPTDDYTTVPNSYGSTYTSMRRVGNTVYRYSSMNTNAQLNNLSTYFYVAIA